MRLSHRPSSHISKKGFLDSKIHLFRNTVIALLSAASLSFAQDKPQDTDQTHAQHGGIAQAINFMHSDDPSEEALDHLIPNDHHIHTILEAHYLHNHATSVGNLELIKEGIGL